MSYQIYVEYSKKGEPKKYSTEIFHNGLKERKIVCAARLDILRTKIENQINNWEKKFNKSIEKEAFETAKILAKEEIDYLIEKNDQYNQNIVSEKHAIENLLIHTLSINDTVDFESLKRHDNFKVFMPSEPPEPLYISYLLYPNSADYTPIFDLWDHIFSFLKKQKIEAVQKKFQEKCEEIKVENEQRQKLNDQKEQDYLHSIVEYKQRLLAWEEEKINFEKIKKEYNENIEHLKQDYFELNPAAILEYCEMVLNNSQYPHYFPKEFFLDYIDETKILIIDYTLPSKEAIPSVKEVKFNKSLKEHKKIKFSETEIDSFFESIAYKTSLRTIHELFEADSANAIDLIAFNGHVNSLSKATGLTEKICILSITAKKEEFLKINLEKVDPKICFLGLKGVGGVKLSGLTPVAPIIKMDKNDKRIIESYSVLSEMQDYTNIATIDWEDFEHLIREVFEKEFSQNGSEVKVTQASRDGGVDAIVYDPDPLRGGKIVIQAKRYTNTVGVSAVRDLYGTVINEGAIKGILVTTANYGPDSFEFIKNKPLSLLNGSNLLYLLEKHGHKVKIDLKECKK